jgi:hypothetical protein
VAIGAAVGSGRLLLATLTVGLLLVVAVRLHSPGPPFQASFWFVGIAVALMTFNAIRLHPNVTIADSVLVLAGIMLVYGLLVAPHILSAVPVWLLLAAGGLLVAALLAEILPPSHLSNEVLASSPGLDSPQNRHIGYVPTQEQIMPANLSFALRLTASVFLLPLIIGLVCTSWQRVATLANVWLAGVAVNAAVATLAGFHLLDLQERLVGHDHSLIGQDLLRLPGLTVHPNALSMACALTIPIAFTRMGAGGRVRYGALVALLATGIFFSGSRAGLVAAPAALVFLLVLQRRLRARTALIGIAASAAVVAYGLASGALSSTIDRAQGASGASSDASRVADYQQALDEVVGRPLVGHGFEVIRFAHSIPLELLHAGGIIALAAFAIFVIGAVRTGVDLGRDRLVPPELQLLATALTASLGVWVLTALVENLVFDRYLYVPAGLLLGMHFVRARLTDSP